MYKISEFGALINRSPKTLRQWDKEGKLKAHRTPSNHRYYTEQQLMQYKGIAKDNDGKVVVYCRVSSAGQKDDLKSQKEYISRFCLNGGISIDEWVEDIGSGLNYKRKGFNRLLLDVSDGLVSTIIIAHPDRFIRFGFDWFNEYCKRYGCLIKIINDERLSPQHELVQDLISIVHVFSCRIYGLRKYKKTFRQDIELKQ